MKTNENTDTAMTLSMAVSSADDHTVMPGEFAGMYQAGFESGYKHGREAGYRQGFNEGTAQPQHAKSTRVGDPAAVHQGPNNGVAAIKTALETKPAPKVGPRRMLLGMPCVHCRVYLLSDEAHCPRCKQPVRAV